MTPARAPYWACCFLRMIASLDDMSLGTSGLPGFSLIYE